MRDEGFGQQPYFHEIHQDRLPVLVDAEAAGVSENMRWSLLISMGYSCFWAWVESNMYA